MSHSNINVTITFLGNLALGKTTYSQSNSDISPDAANGNVSDYGYQSSTSANQWWYVNMGQRMHLSVLHVFSSENESRYIAAVYTYAQNSNGISQS